MQNHQNGFQNGFLILFVVIACAVTGRAHGDAAATHGTRAPRSDVARAEWVAMLREAYSRPSAEWPPPHCDPAVTWREFGLLSAVKHPADNPHSPAKEQLGKALFFEPRLSASGEMACASCHDPDLAWADGRTVSFGHLRKPLARNAPTIRNVAFQESLFWDGRALSIEDQVEAVLLNPAEMHVTREHVVSVLSQSATYRELFARAFGDRKITFDRTAQALACFQRTVVGGHSRFDRFLAGDREVLNDQELIGLDLFRREARCMNCHHGPLLADGQFHDLGLSYYGRSLEDLGRFEVTHEAADVGRFRTPSLRDVTRTRPLMHNGLFELSGVLAMYNVGMVAIKRQAHQHDDPLFPVKSPLLKPLGLNRQDLADLEAFLGTLEEPRRRVRPPSAAPK
jgi:cytochrome c peroxidase